MSGLRSLFRFTRLKLATLAPGKTAVTHSLSILCNDVRAILSDVKTCVDPPNKEACSERPLNVVFTSIIMLITSSIAVRMTS